MEYLGGSIMDGVDEDINLSVNDDETVVVSFSTKKHIKETLKKLTTVTDMSLSKIINEAIHYYLLSQNNTIDKDLLLEEYKHELTTTLAKLKQFEVEHKAAVKQLAEYKRLTNFLITNYDKRSIELNKYRKKFKEITIKQRELQAREFYINKKEKELAEKEEYLAKKEKELRALKKYIEEKEEHVMLVEKVIREKALEKRLPEFVEDLLKANGLQAISLKEIREALFDIFPEEDFIPVIESWEIIKETKPSIFRMVNDKLLYIHYKDKPVQGYFQLNNSE